jgi:hypothetical protein
MVTVGSILGGTFRFIGNNVRAILVWSAILFLLTLLMMVMMRPFYEAQIASLQQPGAVPAAPPMGSFLAFMLVGFAVVVILAAATFRAVLFPEQSRFAYLRVGMDELRLLGCALILVIGFYLIMFVLGIVLGLVLAIVFAAAGGGAGAITASALIGLAGLVFSTWLVTRLALAGPLTILERKIVIGPAWRLTRGHFWSLLGAYAVMMLILFAVYGAIFVVRMGPAMADMFHPTDQAAALRVASAQTAAYSMSLKNIVIAALSSLIFAFAHALYAGGVAVAADQLVNRGGARRLDEVFE